MLAEVTLSIEGDARLDERSESNTWRPSICEAKEGVADQATTNQKNELQSMCILVRLLVW